MASPHPPDSLTVLVVDDDPDMRLYLGRCLLALGAAHIVEADDGLQALLLARAIRVDLVVTDVVMPGLDGPALCRALRAEPHTRAVPVIFVSGETREPPSCADGLVTKPFNAAGLRAVVERVLGPRPPLPA